MTSETIVVDSGVNSTDVNANESVKIKDQPSVAGDGHHQVITNGAIEPDAPNDQTEPANDADGTSEAKDLPPPKPSRSSLPSSTEGQVNEAFEVDELAEKDDVLTEIVITATPVTASDGTSGSQPTRRQVSVQITEPTKESMYETESEDKFDDSELERIKSYRAKFSPNGGGPPGGPGNRRPSMARRASMSLNMMRRKSMDVARHVTNAYRGIILAMISSVFFTLTAAIVKYLKDVHPGQTACFRFLGILLFTIPLVIQSGEHPLGPQGKRHFLIMRGLAGASSLYLRYSALHMLPIANATIIVLSMPIFVCIFARVFLKEPCGIFHVVAIGVTLLGIGFTSKINVLVGLTDSFGYDKEKEMWGLVYSMAATLVGSSAYILVRKVKEVHSSVVLLNFSVVAIIETSIITAMLDGFKMTDCGVAPWLLMCLAVLSFYAQLLLTKALQMEEASIVSVTRASSEVVCAFIFQIVFFQSIPEWNAIVGAVLVSSSVLLTTARKWVVTLPEGHWGRRWFWFTTK